MQAEVASYDRWWHSIDLGNGVVTPGRDKSREKLQFYGFPESFAGKTVVDVGAWDGFFSFEAERRGAARVLATDHYCWQYGRQGFEMARRLLGSRVEDQVIKVEDLSPETVGTFDVVLFLGVLYHAQDPLRYLRNVRSICKGQLILETHVDAEDYSRPAMVFYPGSVLNNDPSNYWGPNRAAVEAMLREVGFPRVEFITNYWGSRIVVHAWV